MGRNTLNYTTHNLTTRTPGKTRAVSALITKEWGQDLYLNPSPSSHIHLQSHCIIRLAQLAYLVLKLSEQRARCQLCPRKPLIPYAHFRQLGMTLHLNSRIFLETHTFDTKLCHCFRYGCHRRPSLHIKMQGGQSCIQSCCQLSTTASYQ